MCLTSPGLPRGDTVSPRQALAEAEARARALAPVGGEEAREARLEVDRLQTLEEARQGPPPPRGDTVSLPAPEACPSPAKTLRAAFAALAAES